MTNCELISLFAEEEILAALRGARKPLTFEELEERVSKRLEKRGAPREVFKGELQIDVVSLLNLGKIKLNWDRKFILS